MVPRAVSEQQAGRLPASPCSPWRPASCSLPRPTSSPWQPSRPPPCPCWTSACTVHPPAQGGLQAWPTQPQGPSGEGTRGMGPSRAGSPAPPLSRSPRVGLSLLTTGSLVRSSWLGGQGACSPLGCSKMRSHGWSSRSPRTQTSELKPPPQGGVGLLRGGRGQGQGAKGRRRHQHERDSRLQLSGQVPAAKVSEVGALGPTGTSSPQPQFLHP